MPESVGTGLKAVFLDRDGTINEDTGYLHRVEDLRLIPGAGQGIAMLNKAGFLVVVVTNQSGIARGYYGEGDLKRVNQEIERRLACSGARVDGWYHCPHHPQFTEGGCVCRKPGTAMVERACRELGIDPQASFVVGDSARDMELASRVGAQGVLVLTGKGEETARSMEASSRQYLGAVVDDILQACRWICGSL